MVELDFDVEPDANGIIDGRELARGMIEAAYALLAPYVNACPACTDALFSAVANGAIEDIHRGGGGQVPGRIMNVEADPDGARWRKHVAETGSLTKAMLGTPDEPRHVH